jgi:endoglucanase
MRYSTNTLFAILSLASVSLSKIMFAGVNEAGGEFGAYGTKGTGLPGVFGRDYAFINKVGQFSHEVWQADR